MKSTKIDNKTGFDLKSILSKVKDFVTLFLKKTRKHFPVIMLYLMLAITVFIVVYPILWIIGSSFNYADSLNTSTMFPKNPTLKQYQKLFNTTQYKIWYANTFKIALGNMVLSVILTITTAYAFSRFKFKGRRQGLMTMLVLQMFPSFMAMVAIYILLLQLKLLDTHIGLILVYAGVQIPFNTWLVKGYLDSIPRSLDEAARIDGASNLTIFWKIIFPLARPILTFVALTNFMSPWMDFILPRLVLRSPDKKTLAIGLFEMITGSASSVKFTMFAAGAVLVAVPITLLYMLLQKYIVEGLTAGASKG